MEIALHIGMHKTGSTSIQEALYGDALGFDVLQLGRNNNHGRVFERAFLEPKTEKDVETRDRLLEEISTQIKASSKNVFLISGERISVIEKAALIRFQDFVRDLCDRVHVIGYVRPPHAYMQSHFQQKLKGGLSGAYSSFEPDRWYSNYRNRFQDFDDVFGQENVTLKLFDRERLVEGDIVADFFSELGVASPVGGNINANASLSLEAVSLLYVLRRYGPEIDFSAPRISRREERVVDRISKIGSRRFYISPKITEPVIKAQHLDIQWMQQRLDVDFLETPRTDVNAVESESDFIRIAMDLAPSVAGLLLIKHEDPITSPEDLAMVLAKLRKEKFNLLSFVVRVLRFARRKGLALIRALVGRFGKKSK